MAKKPRRAKKQGRQIRLSASQMVQPGIGEGAGAPRVTTSAQPTSKVADLGDEYHYVIADLRRIGIIAVVMLAVLVGLALLLT